MEYDEYLRLTRGAAGVINRGEFVSLAGGFYGVRFPTDGAFVLVALDLDEDTGWSAWLENHDGERWCDCFLDIGWVDLERLEQAALVAVIHKCPL